MGPIDGPNRTPPITLLRLSFIGLAGMALILGYVGLADYLSGQVEISGAPADILYYDLQLFVLGAEPLADGGPFSWQLQAARFAAPAATVFAVVETARVLLTSELQRLRVRRTKSHAVVCGDSAVARVLAARLRATGWRVVHILPGPSAESGARHRRVYGLAGDPTNADVLRAAGVARADVVYACTGDSASNVLTAAMAGQLRDGRKSPVRVYAQIHDPELCLALQARRLGQPRPANVRLDFFNPAELAARSLISGDPPPPVPRTRILIAGTSAIGRAILTEAAQYWRVNALHAAGPLHIDLVGAHGQATVNDLFHRYPFLPEVTVVTVHDGEPPVVLRTSAVHPPYHRVYVCLEDEETSLKTALTAQRLWRGGPGTVVVPVSRLGDLATAFTGPHGSGLLDSVSGTIRLFSIVEAAGNPDRICDDLVERLARSIHDRYVLARRALGEESTHNVALVPWPELPEELRRANRSQAEDIGRKLGLIGLALGPRVNLDDSAEINEKQVEYLAAVEHERWRAELESLGWRWGRDRNGAERTHPDLRAWDELPEHTRDKNRQEMQEIPGILADVSLQMVGLGDSEVRRMP